ncbi:hypothetical protein DPEC_G00322740 [Dallia pectoralis]|uniref:Uncharacterized protein n=1 Tax=Dallia pectoralis TaxID=75939 RepID=A0ACC2FAK1_DALPE|nr:hypothetical protein DPEC_G00322740 [Dallia pectoralis]
MDPGGIQMNLLEKFKQAACSVHKMRYRLVSCDAVHLIPLLMTACAARVRSTTGRRRRIKPQVDCPIGRADLHEGLFGSVLLSPPCTLDGTGPIAVSLLHMPRETNAKGKLHVQITRFLYAKVGRGLKKNKKI